MDNFRRTFIKSSLLGTFISSIVGVDFLSQRFIDSTEDYHDESDRYPALKLDLIREVVGVSHGNLEKVQELVGKRPELANATWDWGWGDIETALGAASHMGRRDIAEYLISKGARQDLFSMVMMGQVDVVRTIVEANPGVQRISGPHGITLLQHAKIRMRRKETMETDEVASIESMVSYLEGLGDADFKPSRQSIEDGEKEKYIGEYRYGKGERDILVVSLNMRKNLSVARKGDFGKALYKVGDHTFGLESSPSVRLSFTISDNQAMALKLMEPGLDLVANRI